MERPAELFDRAQEWSDLDRFASSTAPGLQLGVVYGRRRQGKSFLLRRLVSSYGGLYSMALEHDRRAALDRFGDDLARARGLPAGVLRFDGWEPALDEATRLGGLVVLDELPYLLRHSPELPSVVQALYDERRDGPPASLIVCGSSFSVMTDLLSGTRAMRGRATLEMVLGPFDHRTAGSYWGIEDPLVAFMVDAIVGGTPGYRDLVRAAAPRTPSDVGRWLAGSLLDPSHALFREADYLLREDPRLTDRALYHSVLGAIAGGARSPGVLGQRVGRDSRALAHPLDVLVSAGFVTVERDAFSQRRPSYRIADPVLRFDAAVIRNNLADLEERLALDVWRRAQATVASSVYGPHFEHLARAWMRTDGREVVGEQVGHVAPAALNDASRRTRLQLDVVALERGASAPTRTARVLAIGEAKSGPGLRGMDDLERLRRARLLLVESGIDAAAARLVLFVRSGVTAEVRREIAAGADLTVIDLRRMYRSRPTATAGRRGGR